MPFWEVRLLLRLLLRLLPQELLARILLPRLLLLLLLQDALKLLLHPRSLRLHSCCGCEKRKKSCQKSRRSLCSPPVNRNLQVQSARADARRLPGGQSAARSALCAGRRSARAYRCAVRCQA